MDAVLLPYARSLLHGTGPAAEAESRSATHGFCAFFCVRACAQWGGGVAVGMRRRWRSAIGCMWCA